jgi:hypothetical protein
MAPDSKTFTIQDDVKFSGSIVKTLDIAWAGDLQLAILKGTVSGWVSGAGIMGFKIRVNGADVYTDPDQVIVAGLTQFVGDHSVNINPYLRQGNNVFEFVVTQVLGQVATTDFAVNDTLTVQTTGAIDIIPGPPPGSAGTDWGAIAMVIIAVVVVAIAGGLFLRARG